MQSTRRLGDVIKRDQAEALAVRAAADARLDIRKARVAAQDRVRERMRVFHNLMAQGARKRHCGRPSRSARIWFARVSRSRRRLRERCRLP